MFFFIFLFYFFYHVLICIHCLSFNSSSVFNTSIFNVSIFLVLHEKSMFAFVLQTSNVTFEELISEVLLWIK